MGSTSVQDILNGAQDSAAAADRCAGSLWKLALADPDDTYQSLQECMDYLLTIDQKSPFIERCGRFLSVFTSKAPLDNEVASAFIEELLQHLAAQLSVLDKVVRYRGCQLLQHLLSGLPDQFLLDDSTSAALQEQLTERLQDKLVAVRAAAARCISHLARDSQVSPAVLDSMMELLETDKSKDVRVAVVQTLPLNDTTVSVLLECTRDEHPLVRKAVLQRLKDISIRLISIKQRAEVIQHVLLDKDAAVAEAGDELLGHWLQHDCRGDPLRLLQLLDVETYTEAAALAIESLLKTDSIRAPSSGAAAAGCSSAGRSAISYIEAAAASSKSGSKAVGLTGLCHLAEGQLLAPHEALLWRCLCEWLRNDAISKGLAAAATGGARAAVQAAVAAERHEVLERVLPESADQLMQLVMLHVDAGPAARFAALQLLLIAAGCVEWADAASRDMAAPYILKVISLDPVAEAEQAAADMSDSSNDDDGDEEDDVAPAAAGLQLAGNGGDSLLEAAVVQLVVAVQGSGSGFVAAMLDGIASLASAAELLADPKTGEIEVGVTVCEGDSTRLLQCVVYIQLLLQQLPCGKPVAAEGSTLTFAGLWQILLLLALKQGQPVIRAKAVECIALYALTAASHNPGVLSNAVQLLGPLATAGGCAATQQAAVRGLTDLALLFGPAAVDSVLRRPGAARPPAADTASNVDAADDVASPVVAKGLLELLVEQGEVLLAESQAPAGKAKRGSRGAAKAEAPDALSSTSAELLAVVAEGLAKLLLHQRTWLRRYVHWTPPAVTGEAAGADSDSVTPPHCIDGVSTVPFPPDSQQHQALLLVKATALLLQLQFHPAVDSAVQLHQCLGVFFEVFAAAAKEFRLQLVAACLPAARQALHVSGKQNPAAVLVKDVVELLQMSHIRQQQPATAGCLVLMVDGQPATFEALAMQLLHEVNSMAAVTVACGVQVTKYKAYLSSLLKLVCELPLQPSSHELEALQALCDRLSDSITDTAVKKDVGSVQQMLQRLARESGHDQSQLPSEQLEQLIANLEALSLQLPCPPEGICAASSDAVTPAPRTARKPATARTVNKGAGTAGRTGTKGPARKRAAVSSSSSDDSSSSSDEEESEDGSSDSSGVAQEGGTAETSAVALGSSAAQVASTKHGATGGGTARRRQPLGPSSIANTTNEPLLLC